MAFFIRIRCYCCACADLRAPRCFFRLNAFGFLVTNAQHGAGNYGFQDQILALRWIGRNIRKFGGDPDKVREHARIDVFFSHSPIDPSV